MKFKKYTALFILFWIFISTLKCYAQEEDKWNIFSTRFCTVFYEKGTDLKIINRRINLSFSDFYSPRSFKKEPGLSVEDIVSDKMDAIFNKVEELLDMYPARIHVAIRVYKNKEDLDRLYEEFFHEPNTAVSFYIYKTNTIYTTESAVSASILAHEMAHCIIDHYFVILPPRKIQEILAVYADVHLKD